MEQCTRISLLRTWQLKAIQILHVPSSCTYLPIAFVLSQGDPGHTRFVFSCRRRASRDGNFYLQDKNHCAFDIVIVQALCAECAAPDNGSSCLSKEDLQTRRHTRRRAPAVISRAFMCICLGCTHSTVTVRIAGSLCANRLINKPGAQQIVRMQRTVCCRCVYITKVNTLALTFSTKALLLLIYKLPSPSLFIHNLPPSLATFVLHIFDDEFVKIPLTFQSASLFQNVTPSFTN